MKGNKQMFVPLHVLIKYGNNNFLLAWFAVLDMRESPYGYQFYTFHRFQTIVFKIKVHWHCNIKINKKNKNELFCVEG